MNISENNSRVTVSLLEICGVALAYYWLYDLNGWIFKYFSVSIHVGWIFLPAAVRIITVMLFGWRAVIGLFIGTFSICFPILGINNVDSYSYSILSSCCPMLAVSLGMYLMKSGTDLGGLRSYQLFVFAFLGAFISSLSHNIYFQLSGNAASWLTGLIPMFVGDMVGTMMVLYTASALIRILPIPTASQYNQQQQNH